jgi:hypothetical protein
LAKILPIVIAGLANDVLELSNIAPKSTMVHKLLLYLRTLEILI